jgi:hypothetical protein
MVINAYIARKKGKKRRKIMYTVVEKVGVVFTWSVHISKYGVQGRCPKKEI